MIQVPHKKNGIKKSVEIALGILGSSFDLFLSQSPPPYPPRRTGAKKLLPVKKSPSRNSAGQVCPLGKGETPNRHFKNLEK